MNDVTSFEGAFVIGDHNQDVLWEKRSNCRWIP